MTTMTSGADDGNSEAFELGVVKWFNNSKGYGFIRRDQGGDDVFVHFRSIEGKGFRTLTEGTKVKFVVTQGAKGPQADRVSVLDEE